MSSILIGCPIHSALYHIEAKSFVNYYILDTYRRNDNDAIIKTQEDFFNNIYLSLYCKGSRRLFKVCVWEGARDRTQTVIFWPQTYGHQRCVFLVLLILNRRSWGPLCWVLAFFTASYQHLLWTPIHQGPKPLRPGVAFPTTSRLSSPTVCKSTGCRTQLRYIIVQRPLDLWNRMFNRHQAEITVMQFRGHSLPVRQSMRVSWDFLACPILLANFRPRNFLSYLPLECVTSFRCITLNGILGRVEGQNITNLVSYR